MATPVAQPTTANTAQPAPEPQTAVEVRLEEGTNPALAPCAPGEVTASPGPAFGLTVLAAQGVLLALYGAFVKQEFATVCSKGGVAELCALSGGAALAEERYYKFYVDIALMMFVGFGYLMTFLQHYGLGAVGFTMLITSFVVQWSIVVEGFLLHLNEGHMHQLSISFLELIDGNFAAATVLISFGAVIGKIGPFQIAIMSFLEVIFYALNKRFLMIHWFGVADIGGSIVIHCFGAYFGLAVSYILGKPTSRCIDNASSSNSSDLFSLIGTVFLWLYWPSFVTAMPGTSTEETSGLMVSTACACTHGPKRWRPLAYPPLYAASVLHTCNNKAATFWRSASAADQLG
jgi:hypothetical protein